VKPRAYNLTIREVAGSFWEMDNSEFIVQSARIFGNEMILPKGEKLVSCSPTQMKGDPKLNTSDPVFTSAGSLLFVESTLVTRPFNAGEQAEAYELLLMTFPMKWVVIDVIKEIAP